VEEDALEAKLFRTDADAIMRKILKSPRFWIPMAIGTLVAAYGASNFIDWLTGRNLKTYVTTLEMSSSNKVAEAYGAVTNQIVAEFQTPRISEVVRGVAENQAQAILRKDVTPVVEQFKSDVGSKLHVLEDEQHFLTVANSARAYDLSAYLELIQIASQTNAESAYAGRVREQIYRELEFEKVSLSKMVFREQNGKLDYAGPFTSDEIAVFLTEPRMQPGREGLVNWVQDKGFKLLTAELIELLHRENNLVVAKRITWTLSGLTGKEFDVQDIPKLDAWWATHKSNFTNWPYAAYGLGINAMHAGKYPDALSAFTQVLHVDTNADMSRAFAAACALELGQTNDASSLKSSFIDPSGRWAQWADAQAELTTGNVSTATIKFVNLATNYPTFFPAAFQQTLPNLLRKVDMKVFFDGYTKGWQAKQDEATR
jgi:hypothetical protein